VKDEASRLGQNGKDKRMESREVLQKSGVVSIESYFTFWSPLECNPLTALCSLKTNWKALVLTGSVLAGF